MADTVDAVVVVSFGGPEGPDDVVPFLEKVVHGRGVPRSRLLEVARTYAAVGGVSPLNAHNRALVGAVEAELARGGHDLPVYWGNRNWHPLLGDTVARMADDGVRRAAAFVTSAYSSYSGCRQYLEDLAAARELVGPGAPELIKLRPFYDHPGFVEAMAEGLRRARADAGRAAPLLFSAHSIPAAQAATCDYVAQLRTAAALVAAAAGERPDGWRLVFQSRSGRPGQPWLGPDIGEAIGGLEAGTDAVVVTPLGFVSDHMEVVHDLDTVAAGMAASRNVRLVRSATPGTHPAFVAMVRQLVEELCDPPGPALALDGPPPVCPCPPGCCPPPAPGRPAEPSGCKGATA